MLSKIATNYPKKTQLEDGAKITLSLMSPDDGPALSKFLGRLTSSDLLDLQADISKPEIQENWLKRMAKGESVCVAAYDPASLVGYASVQINDHAKAPAGEIRLNINKGYRSRGLGRRLISEIIQIARDMNVGVVTARMLSDQHGAKAAFRRLGFTEKALLEGAGKDANGKPKDLLVMTSEL